MELMSIHETYHTEKTIPKTKKKKYSNVLKFEKSARYYIKKKHSIREDELECLIFFYDEKYFTTDTFYRFLRVLSWDKLRIERLVDKNLLVVYKIKGRSFIYRHVYILSDYALEIVDEYYDILFNERRMSEAVLMKKNEFDRIPYQQKKYLELIRKSNEVRKMNDKSLANDYIFIREK